MMARSRVVGVAFRLASGLTLWPLAATALLLGVSGPVRAEGDQESIVTQIQRKRCVTTAREDYEDEWRQSCAQRGEASHCMLSPEVASVFDQRYHRKEDLCR